jgi:polyisoprenyl-teichoic acid--peptidoglycan teichoic acid transferase
MSRRHAAGWNSGNRVQPPGGTSVKAPDGGRGAVAKQHSASWDRAATVDERRRRTRSTRLTRRRQLRRQRILRRFMAGLLMIAIALVTAGISTWVRERSRSAPEEEVAPVEQPGERPQQDTLLLVRHAGDGRPAEGATLLAVGPGEESAVALFVPVGTLLPIPGIGRDRLGLAQQYDGPTLVQSTLENALGIRIDHVAAVSDSSLASLLERVGGLDVDVPQRLVARAPDGDVAVRFEPGRQFLDGLRLAELWGFRERDEDELATFTRQQLVWERFLDKLADPATLELVVGDGAPQLETGADAGWLRSFFAQLAAARAEERITFSLLPVEPFGGEGPDGGATYRLREEAAQRVTRTLLAASVPDDAAGGTTRIQILNGVGVPGVGGQVERLLGGGAFRIVRSDNAANFDFTTTRILVYDESGASRRAAERVRERLGVGTIQVSRQPQSVIDLTIVVGADFVELHGVGEGGALPTESASG